MQLDVPFAVDWVHRLRFTRDVFDVSNPTLVRAFDPTRHGAARVIAFVDDGVLQAWPGLERKIETYAAAQGVAMELVGVHAVVGGEACKNDQQLQYRLCRALHDARICRQSYVLAIGGGAVLDAVGFACAITHRGVRLVRLPTTTLSQDDSGVGVKNGINAFNKKNFLGAFATPWAVINDELFLTTLSDRDWRSGFSEAVKVALVKDAALFERLRANARAIARRDFEAAVPVIRRSAELHLRHITSGGDPFELTSARPLDFGHWAAHKLESMTHFELRHGEAVAIGVALDASYSALAGLLNPDDAREVVQCLCDLGFQLHDPVMRDTDTLLKGIEEFREHLGGRLTIAMLSGIGRQHDVHEVDLNLMRRAAEELATVAAVQR